MTELALNPACPHCGAILPACGACAGACGTLSGASGGCALLSCPGCGRAFPHPRRSWLAWRLARWLAAREQRRAAAQAARAAAVETLGTLPRDSRARIVSLNGTDDGRGRQGNGATGRAQQLAALGLVPGVEVRLRQRRPAVVLEVGETTLALDAALAREIRVERQSREPIELRAAQPAISGSRPS